MFSSIQEIAINSANFVWCPGRAGLILNDIAIRLKPSVLDREQICRAAACDWSVGDGRQPMALLVLSLIGTVIFVKFFQSL